MRSILLFSTALLLCAIPARAQDASARGADDLTVYLATFGPGDNVWEKFGHNALWLHDATTGRTVSYNYGIFDFEQPAFVPRLMKGRMLYSMGVNAAEDEVAAYAYYNRSVHLQRLAMSAAQKQALREFLEWNALPQNRDYRYDYFRDNCSTRIRDALDRVLGGTLAGSTRGVPTNTTYRSHSLRLTAGSPATYTGLLIGLGMPTDRPIDAWEESFIPMRLMHHLRGVRVAGPDGEMIPLVAEERTVVEARRDPPPPAQPRALPLYLIAGILSAGALLLLARAAATRRPAALALALGISLWGVISGFLGVILALLWLFTDHAAAYPNLSLLQVSPLGFLLAAAAPLHIAARAGSRAHAVARLALATALAVLVLSVIGLLLYLLPGVVQENASVIAFALPVHTAIVLCVWQARVRPASSSTDTRARTPAPARP